MNYKTITTKCDGFSIFSFVVLCSQNVLLKMAECVRIRLNT